VGRPSPPRSSSGRGRPATRRSWRRRGWWRRCSSRSQARGARALLEAIAAAELAGHDAARAEALLLLAKGQAGDERDRTLQLAQGALKRAGPDPRIERMIGLELGAAPP
jgi:CO/xanthine dehydrogenase Mo-binding subunit